MKIFIFLVTVASSINFNPAPVSGVSPTYYARSIICMETNTGDILYGHNIHLSRSVASVSKIMTALIAIEDFDLELEVNVPPQINQAVGSMIYLKEGQLISMNELVYGLMLRSGNDAAIAIAINVAGSIESFVERMNERAQKYGMINTLFRNPHGLDEFDGGNISSAYDLAKLTSVAINNDKFKLITGAKEFYSSSLQTTWYNKNRLLGLYNYATGGKTGYTKIAKRTLVTTASKDGTDLTVVTLDCGGDFAYHKNIYETMFSSYQTRLLLDKGEHIIDNYLLYNDKPLFYNTRTNLWDKSIFLIHVDPLKESASAILYLNNEKIQLKTLRLVKKLPPPQKSLWDKIIDFFRWF